MAVHWRGNGYDRPKNDRLPDRGFGGTPLRRIGDQLWRRLPQRLKNGIRHRSDSKDSRRLAALGGAGCNHAGLLLLPRYCQKAEQGPNGEGSPRKDDPVSLGEETAFRTGGSSERKEPFRI
jgi:hypothetical protein